MTTVTMDTATILDSTPSDATSDSTPVVDECAEWSDCADGQGCVDGAVNGVTVFTCRELCWLRSSPIDPCPAGQVCAPFAGDGALGFCRIPCTTDLDCEDEGETCDLQSGLCRDCPGLVCPDDQGCNEADGQCVRSCDVDQDCGCHTICIDGLCLAGCNTDSDCCSDATCMSGVCERIPHDSSLADGQRCPYGVYCSSGTCSGAYDRGMCLPPPDSDVTGCAPDACPLGTVCAHYTAASGSAFRGCLPPCVDDTQCPDFSVCADVVGGERACLPACTDDVRCGPGATCELGSGLCQCFTDDACKRTHGPNAVCDTAAGTCSCEPSCTACEDDGCFGAFLE